MLDTPQRPESHRIGDVGQTSTALCFQRWGWTADSISSDYGEDLECTIFSEGRRTAFYFRCQVKSTARAGQRVRKLKTGEYSVPIETTTAKAWLLSYFPVFITVYDDSNNQIYWADATNQIREKVALLSQSTLTLHVPPRRLESGQAEIRNIVSDYYAKLLQLTSPTLECNVFPVLMPGYRALPTFELHDTKLKADSFSLSLEHTSRHIDSLPAWATAINVLSGTWLNGWQVSMGGENLDAFLSTTHRFLESFSYLVGNDEWICFVCDPIRFQAETDQEQASVFWSQELIGWGSYSLLRNRIISDHEHAFAHPVGFLRQISRHSHSWEGYWYVHPDFDLALQLYAEEPTTPAYRAYVSAQNSHAMGQFIPWVCRHEEIVLLRERLATAQLAFREIETETLNPPEGYVYGAIAAPFFDPMIGMIPQAHSWEEFQKGSVRTALETHGLLERLPGHEGASEIRDFVMGLFGEAFGRAIDKVIVSAFDHITGLPLDHQQRMAVVHRLRRVDAVAIELLEKQFDNARQDLANQFQELNVEISWQLIEEITGKIADVYVSWTPALGVSSSESLSSNLHALLDFFNDLLSQVPSPESKPNNSTMGILKCEGRLYFEGDDPWGSFRKSK